MNRLVWVSGREIGTDLASTTEICICQVLGENGVDAHLISPGSIVSEHFNHTQVSKWSFPGLNTISGARNIRKMMRCGQKFPRDYDVLLVDWRYVFSLRRELRELSIPWLLVDRGPPSYLGLLNRLQKIYWKNAWDIADKFAMGALVVSKEHKNFIIERLNVELEIREVPAGSFPNQFLKSKTKPKEELLLTYIGRIDRRRGTEGIIELSESLNDLGISHRISVAGEGDMRKEIENQSKKRRNFQYLGRLGAEEIYPLLAKSHIGIMPMPDIPIWRISSPLKLSEYLASGLAIIGPSHEGNRLKGTECWDLLSTNGDWVGQAVTNIKRAVERDWDAVVSASIESSKELSWHNIGANLIGELEQLINPMI